MSQLILEAGRSESQYWRDLWRYRELFYVLAWRDVSVKYKQTAIGILWALIPPLANVLVFTFVFKNVANLPSGGVPYPLLVMAGMLPWNFFSNALSAASGSLLGSSGLISKVYFPRMIIPASAVVTTAVDFFISFAIMISLMVWFRYLPPLQILLLPFFIILAFLAALGPGLILTALNVKFRDFRFIVPFVLQFGIYISPVGYFSSLIQQKYGLWARLAYSANPAVGVIDGFRWCLLGGQQQLFVPGLVMSLSVTTLLLLIGIKYFRKTEKTFADVI
jgi:lipopolysaccharide transport system permease protein